MLRNLLRIALAAALVGGLYAQAPTVPGDPVSAVVGRLDLAQFKAHLQGLTQFGDRQEGTGRNRAAIDWLEKELRSYGYTNVTRQKFRSSDGELENIWATKVGSTTPGEMYIVSAHMDGRGGGEAADDDGSGCALVLEVARVLAMADVQTNRSVRFAFWNNEEFGMDGSGTYMASRGPLQGTPEEPRWLGLIHHDMVMYDHGMPPGPGQSPAADINVDYQVESHMADGASRLADALAAANKRFKLDYPVTVGSNMAGTDSIRFMDAVPSVSVREAPRVTGIEAGSNPHHHEATDLVETYSEADFRLGFTALKTTLGALGELAGIRVTRPAR